MVCLRRLGLAEVSRKSSIESPESASATVTFHTPPATPPESSPAGIEAATERTMKSNVPVPPPVADVVAAPASPLLPPAQVGSSAAKPPARAPKATSPSSNLKQPAKSSPRFTMTILASAAAIALVADLSVRAKASCAADHPDPRSGSCRLGSRDAAFRAGATGGETVFRHGHGKGDIR